MNAGDVDRLSSLAEEGAVLVFPGGAAWDSLLAAGPGPFPPRATKEITPQEVRVLSEDWAYELGTSTVTWTPEGAEQERTIRYTFLALPHRTLDGWKVHREVASSRPLPETQP